MTEVPGSLRVVCVCVCACVFVCARAFVCAFVSIAPFQDTEFFPLFPKILFCYDDESPDFTHF